MNGASVDHQPSAVCGRDPGRERRVWDAGFANNMCGALYLCREGLARGAREVSPSFSNSSVGVSSSLETGAVLVRGWRGLGQVTSGRPRDTLVLLRFAAKVTTCGDREHIGGLAKGMRFQGPTDAAARYMCVTPATRRRHREERQREGRCGRIAPRTLKGPVRDFNGLGQRPSGNRIAQPHVKDGHW